MTIGDDDTPPERCLEALTTWRAALTAGVPWRVVESLVLRRCESRPEVLREFVIAAETTPSGARLRLVA